jgi:hypothetical protein
MDCWGGGFSSLYSFPEAYKEIFITFFLFLHNMKPISGTGELVGQLFVLLFKE